MENYEQRFWTHDRYDDLVELYDRHVETTHPDFVTSDRVSPYTHYGRWGRTSVCYREYRGPQL